MKLIPVKHRKWCTANFSSLQTKKQPFRILTKVNKQSMGLVGAAKLNWDKFVKRMIKSAFLRYHNFQNITFDVYRKCITNHQRNANNQMPIRESMLIFWYLNLRLLPFHYWIGYKWHDDSIDRMISFSNFALSFLNTCHPSYIQQVRLLQN